MVPGGEEGGDKSVVVDPVVFASTAFVNVFSILTKMKTTPQSQSSKGGLPLVSMSSAGWPLPPAVPLPVLDLLQQ